MVLLLIAALLVQPASFEPLFYEQHPPEFHAEAAEDWADIARSDCGEAETWLNFLLHARYAKLFGNYDYDLPALLDEAERRIDSTSFTRHFLRAKLATTTEERYRHLQLAHAAEPDRVLAYSGLITLYTLNGSDRERDSLLRHWHHSKPFPPELLTYNYNQLMSVAPNGILLTHGDADTYPSWMLQTVLNVRPDVTVISRPLAENFAEYREAIVGRVEPEEIYTALARQDRPLHVAVTNFELPDALSRDDLYLVGLTQRYSDEPFDNLAANTRLFGENFLMDFLELPANPSSPALRMELGYSIGLLLLEKQAPGEPWSRQLAALGRRTGMEKTIAGLRQPATPEPSLATAEAGISARRIETHYVPIPGTEAITNKVKFRNYEDYALYRMGSTEVSHADYDLFLEDLLRGRHYDLLQDAAPERVDWAAIAPLHGLRPTEAILFMMGHPDGPDHPATNLTHTGAELYARWLTEAYNADPKRRFDAVFRLPTPEEFEYAARAGREHAPYPWGGPYVNNAKGCYLANFDATTHTLKNGDYAGAANPERNAQETEDYGGTGGPGASKPKADGAILPVNVEAYYPNDFGLYNMAGNVAEMLTQPGRVAGGSFLDSWEDITVESVRSTQLPAPDVGFRLVMDVKARR